MNLTSTWTACPGFGFSYRFPVAVVALLRWQAILLPPCCHEDQKARPPLPAIRPLTCTSW